MPCQDCKPDAPITVFPLPILPCGPENDQQCCEQSTNAACVEYDGTPLGCIGGDERQMLDDILQRIDVKLCEITGGSDPFNEFNVLCLEPVTTAKDFAERTAAMLCQLRTTVVNFINNLYPVEISTIRTEIATLNRAGFDRDCGIVTIAKGDTLTATLAKLTEAICTISDAASNMSSVDWDRCVTIAQPPTTIQEGFNFILQQLCALTGGGSGGNLPVFDNTTSCLPAPTSADSLENTVIKIRSRLCSLPTFSVNAVSSTCLSLNGVTTLEQTISKILEQLDTLSRNTVRQVDNIQFAISDADPTVPCAGKKISLSGVTGTGADRLVALNEGDTTPGTLEQKINAGEGVVIDTTSVAGKMTIRTTNTVNHKVKIAEDDPEPGYLIDKIVGAPGEVNTIITASAQQISISASIDYDKLIDRLFDILETDAELKERFCALVASCPSPCSPPTNVQAIPVT